MTSSFVWTTLLIIIVYGLLLEHVACYSTIHRRGALQQIGKAFPILSGAFPGIANAKEESDVSMITDATDALSSLIENWERATVDCTYADVPRELLEAKNKEKLLEKASEFALFDKSTSIVSCKRTNRVVRDYIGATGKGPLVNLEKRLLKKNVVEQVDPDRLDDYFAAVEKFSQEMAKANSLSYTAGMADFDAVNNFAKGEANIEESNSNLDRLDDYFAAVEKFSQEMAKANSLSYTAGMADFDAVNNFAKGEANIEESNSNLDQARRAIEEANKALKVASSLIAVS
ncbi:hypothetical protein ACHAWC_004131 [Mediolabrus comicus]